MKKKPNKRYKYVFYERRKILAFDGTFSCVAFDGPLPNGLVICFSFVFYGIDLKTKTNTFTAHIRS